MLPNPRKKLPNPSKEIVLTKALLRASEQLGIERSELSLILGVSESTLSRLANLERSIDPNSKEGQLSVLFLQIYQSLMYLFGGEIGQCQSWLRHSNAHLNGIPLELLKQISGVILVLNYLEFMQEKI